MRVILCLILFFCTINVVCGNRRRGGGGGGGGRNTDREVQEAINRANEENQRKINQLREEAERNRLRALEEARIINEQAERLRIQQEQEKADQIADQNAFIASQNLAQEQIKNKQVQQEEKHRLEGVEAEAYKKTQYEDEKNNLISANVKNEIWNKENIDNQNNYITEILSKIRLEAEAWKEAYSKITKN